MPTTEYQVNGMSCGHCEVSIRSEVEKIDGVTGVEVSSANGRLVVVTSGDAPADDPAVFAAVDEAGYDATRV